jgi:DNA repair protein SbcC/Rad50
MILNKIRLENFISHKKTELELGYGINVVVGPNGAGKTSILDGISFALFSDSSSRGKKENLINSRAKRCKVGLGFTEGGIGYDVEWSMERKGSAQGSLFRLAGKKRNLLVRGGERVVVPEVQKVLGIDKNMFLQSVYVRQGEIEKLVTARPGDRKELISRLLGVEDLERAWNGMKAVIQVYSNAQIKLETELARKPAVEKQRDDAEAKAKELSLLLASKRKKLGAFESELKNLEADLEKLVAKKKDFDKLDKERGIIWQRIENLEGKLDKAEEELRKAVSAAEILSKLVEDVNRLPFLDAYVNGLAEKNSLELKQSALQTKLDELTSLKKTLDENAKDHELFLEKEKLLTEKKAKRKEFEGSDMALAKAKKELAKCEKEEKRRNENLNGEIAKYSAALEESVSVDNIGLVLERVRKRLEEKAKEFDAKVKDNATAIGVLNQRLKELDENLLKFSSVGEVKACPTCDTELSPERVTQLVSKYTLERRVANADVATLKSDSQEAERQREQVYEKKKQIDALDPERLGSLALELAEASNEVAGEKLEISKFEKQTEMLAAIDKELECVEGEKRAFDEAYREYELAKRQLDKMPSEEAIEKEKKPLTVALQEVAKKLDLSVEKLGYEPKEPQEELVQLRKMKEEYDQNLPIAKRKTEYESSVTSTSKELEDCRNAHSKTARALEDLCYDEIEHATKQEEHKNKSKEVKNFTADIAATEQAKIGAEDETRRHREELEVLEAKTAEKKLVDNYITVLNKIRDAYGKDGIQKLIRAKARPLLEKTTRDLFERFNLAYSDIKIDDDYNISVIGPSGEQDIDQISGGERVALAIALRLAIAQVLSGRIETVIMDEPTTHLDEERRKELVNILNSFFREGGRIIPQMLIITHHSEIEEVADLVYFVKKKEGYSSVESGKLSQPFP